MTDQATAGLTRRGLLGVYAASVVVAAPTYTNAFGLLKGAGDIRRIRMYSGRTGEMMDTVYWVDGEYIPEVAKEINQVGAGASTFADWWAFKVEVIDGIPNNAAMMLRQGVNVSLNSDSQDLGRRLNTEAAKAVRYGNLSETEALQLVTLNPAKQLQIDAEVGSIEVGKSADLVLWNHAPLSTMARADTVWIDGRVYFDRSADQVEQARVDSARAALIQTAMPERLNAAMAPAQKSAAPGVRLNVALQWHTTKHWPSIWMAKRGLYHNGEASHFCTDGE